MKRVIRRGVFETNSSSVHSLTMCSDEEWKAWERGEITYDWLNDKFIINSEDIAVDDDLYISFEYFTHNYYHAGYELYKQEYTTNSGEIIHAFGYYGHD